MPRVDWTDVKKWVPKTGETVIPYHLNFWPIAASSTLIKQSIESHSTINMICRSCLRAASRSRTPEISSIRASRSFSTTTTLRNATPISVNTATQAAPRQGSSTSSHTPPAATSTSAAQPFSEPLTPAASPSLKKDAAAAAKKKAAPLVKSSIPAGTPLKGLNFLKDKGDPVAMADEEYPEWLWTLLAKQEKKGESAAQGDLFCKPLLLTPSNIPFVPHRHISTHLLTNSLSQIQETASYRRKTHPQRATRKPRASRTQGTYLRADD